MKCFKIVAVGLCLVILTAVSICWADENAPRILFDQGHGQRFLVHEEGPLNFSGLTAIMETAGAKVSSTRAPLSDATLKGIAALVISGPFMPISAEESEAIIRYIQGGGRVAMMLHIAPPMGSFLRRLGVAHSNGVLHEGPLAKSPSKDIEFSVSDLAIHPLFAGVPSFSAYGAWALNSQSSAAMVAKTSKESWVDLNNDKVLGTGDAKGPFGIVVSQPLGAGEFVIFGDDAIFQNMFLDENNRKLAANLASWLLKKNVTPVRLHTRLLHQHVPPRSSTAIL